MALSKNIEKGNIQANYWRIVGFNITFTGKMCQIFLCGYESEETRAESKNLLSNNFIIKGDKFDKYVSLKEGVAVARLYEYLLEETKEFKGAVSLV